MEVIDKYLECKLKTEPLRARIKWLDTQMSIVRVSCSSDSDGGGGGKSNKLDKCIGDKQRFEKELKECEAFVEYVDVVLRALEEKHKGRKYDSFEMRYINKMSLRDIASEINYSHVYVKEVTEDILKEFETLTKVLVNEY